MLVTGGEFAGSNRAEGGRKGRRTKPRERRRSSARRSSMTPQYRQTLRERSISARLSPAVEACCGTTPRASRSEPWRSKGRSEILWLHLEDPNRANGHHTCAPFPERRSAPRTTSSCTWSCRDSSELDAQLPFSVAKPLVNGSRAMQRRPSRVELHQQPRLGHRRKCQPSHR